MPAKKVPIPPRLSTKKKSTGTKSNSKKVVVKSPEKTENSDISFDANQNPLGAGGFGSFTNENGGYSLYQAKKAILVTEDLPAVEVKRAKARLKARTELSRALGSAQLSSPNSISEKAQLSSARQI